MKIRIVSVGKVRQSFIRDGEAEYLKRIKGNGLVVTLEELGLDSPQSLRPEEIKEREGEEILKRIKAGELVVVLDERGKSPSSKEFAHRVDQWMQSGTKTAVFVIGGAYGFSEKVRHAADYVLSLSSMTLPHQLTRLMLVEQLYRVQTLLQGTGYHK
jgi:23S rRNA (pseudouridine1915-N3)-methyltransferase